MADPTDKDLPLLSNINDISINHYIFNFLCSFEEKCFLCHVLLILEPVINSEVNRCTHFDHKDINDFHPSKISLDIKENTLLGSMFMLILDCHKIIVDDVEEICMTYSEKENFKYAKCNPILLCSKRKLNFITDKWSLKIWKDSNTCKLCFPKFIRISYKTMPEGPSLLWVTDQDKK